MAHIANCLGGSGSDSDDLPLSLNGISKAVTPQASNDSLNTTSSGEIKPFAWRMQQATERKYQLFPKERQASIAPGKALDPEQAFALAMSQNGEKGEKTPAVTGLRIRIKEHNLTRRRKVSVPELGPMTTVQEVAMDSPTIPGRPPFHERSISAPGTSWKQNQMVDFLAPTLEQSPEQKHELRSGFRSYGELRQPLSPKNLAPLVIPPSTSAVPRLARQISLSRLRSGSTPVDVPIRSAKTDDSPKVRTPFTPFSAALTPASAATTAMTNSTLPTPVSAPMSAPIEHRASPKPWERVTNYAVVGTPKEGSPDPSATPKAEINDETPQAPQGHARNVSDTGSIMERGRPRKRSDLTVIGAVKRRAESKRSTSAERKAFEQLPKGWKASEAVNMLSPVEAAALHKQALQQAARFEVLRKDDVDNLSRELRQLDERTEYLRRTYTSLRAGRRNLHTRICQYLRSPRTAKFSHESMLKQEEALAELDASIDDWVTKLEHAENRRMRVRQKLLEHVAAAATLAVPPAGVAGVSESLQLAMGVRPLNCPASMSTPPRSPTKTAVTQTSPTTSPQRVVAQVPSTIMEDPWTEEAAPTEEKKAGESGTTLKRAETIRIYADNDVYALLADVEQTISNMGGTEGTAKEEPLSDVDRKRWNRTRGSQMFLKSSSPARMPFPVSKLEAKSSSSSLSSTSTPPTTTTCSTTSTSPIAAPTQAGEEVYLTNAVFKP
ncbi:Up-regulated during septation-domain-containing protein [Triangularia verruculosa]|uniref:Up-regulated during septation-domain-containing protein n=1 Tax=Triangularia verruculosa TaxID=2587418 RepID=A0AAN7AZ34_9PEZI|nr:Up-regulated during septation-domain-containing protein [Triangularia verruculosa]